MWFNVSQIVYFTSSSITIYICSCVYIKLIFWEYMKTYYYHTHKLKLMYTLQYFDTNLWTVDLIYRIKAIDHRLDYHIHLCALALRLAMYMLFCRIYFTDHCIHTDPTYSICCLAVQPAVCHHVQQARITPNLITACAIPVTCRYLVLYI